MRHKLLSLCGALVALGAVAALQPAPSHAQAHTASGGRVIQGVNFTGDGRDTRSFARAVGNKPRALTFYEKWGTRSTKPFNVWRRTHTLGVFSISTGQSHDSRHSRISLRSIAQGEGDGYILWLNRQMSNYRSYSPTYVVLFPEMNGYWNPYSTYSKDGFLRSRSYTSEWYRKAFQRVSVILDGGPTKAIDRRLRRLGMPGLRRASIPQRSQQSSSYLPQPPVDMIWIPQERGSPDFPDNGPEAYWPGERYVDWVGLNTFSKWSKFPWLEWFYQNELWKNKPMAIGEFAVCCEDQPGWVDGLFEWARSHPRLRMMIYYQGFQSKEDPYRIQNYPAAEARMRAQLNDPIIHRPGGDGPPPPPPKPKPDPRSPKPESAARDITTQKSLAEDSRPAPQSSTAAPEPNSTPWWAIALGAVALGAGGYGAFRWRQSR